MSKFKDITGQTFGKLTAVSFSRNDRHHNAIWTCVCECGTRKDVLGCRLRSGDATSCGCDFKTEKHGMRKSAEYKAWEHMKHRCYNKNNPMYPRYGGRGISVCDRWVDSFSAFLLDMGEKPSAKHSLDRIDNNGDYSPENCRWATVVQQANNTRRNRMVVAFGETRSVAQWARHIGLNEKTLHQRIFDMGIPPEVALTAPLRSL